MLFPNTNYQFLELIQAVLEVFLESFWGLRTHSSVQVMEPCFSPRINIKGWALFEERVESWHKSLPTLVEKLKFHAETTLQLIRWKRFLDFVTILSRCSPVWWLVTDHVITDSPNTSTMPILGFRLSLIIFCKCFLNQPRVKDIHQCSLVMRPSCSPQKRGYKGSP